MEIFDFTINALRELEAELNQLVGGLADVTDTQNAKVKDLSLRFSRLEKKLASLEGDVERLRSLVLASPIKPELNQGSRKDCSAENMGSCAVMLSCCQWEDFQAIAWQPQILAFDCMEDGDEFHASALIGNQIVTYQGKLPEMNQLLKPWLANQLGVLIEKSTFFDGTIVLSRDSFRVEQEELPHQSLSLANEAAIKKESLTERLKHQLRG